MKSEACKFGRCADCRGFGLGVDDAEIPCDCPHHGEGDERLTPNQVIYPEDDDDEAE